MGRKGMRGGSVKGSFSYKDKKIKRGPPRRDTDVTPAQPIPFYEVRLCREVKLACERWLAKHGG